MGTREEKSNLNASLFRGGISTFSVLKTKLHVGIISRAAQFHYQVNECLCCTNLRVHYNNHSSQRSRAEICIYDPVICARRDLKDSWELLFLNTLHIYCHQSTAGRIWLFAYVTRYL
ncbi:hypothetical protein GQX74_001338 [Glossina fuscipes]|nr:hypothetical protein GQX74_001338 [Glossina fuscipes]